MSRKSLMHDVTDIMRMEGWLRSATSSMERLKDSIPTALSIADDGDYDLYKFSVGVSDIIDNMQSLHEILNMQIRALTDMLTREG